MAFKDNSFRCNSEGMKSTQPKRDKCICQTVHHHDGTHQIRYAATSVASSLRQISWLSATSRPLLSSAPRQLLMINQQTPASTTAPPTPPTILPIVAGALLTVAGGASTLAVSAVMPDLVSNSGLLKRPTVLAAMSKVITFCLCNRVDRICSRQARNRNRSYRHTHENAAKSDCKLEQPVGECIMLLQARITS